MKCSRGDVVLLDYPFNDGSGQKVRPALIVQSDAYNAKLTSTIVALITKNISRAQREPSQFLIDLSTTEGQASGLRVSSAVTCNNLYTVHESRIIQILGRLGPTLMQRIDGCLRIVLGL